MDSKLEPTIDTPYKEKNKEQIISVNNAQAGESIDKEDRVEDELKWGGSTFWNYVPLFKRKVRVVKSFN